MNLGEIAALFYGIIAILGGIFGYIQAKSKISLLAGCGCGILLLISAIVQLQGQSWGLFVAMGVTVILIMAFVMRLLKTRKFMPAGLMLALGIPSLGVMVSQMF